MKVTIRKSFTTCIMMIAPLILVSCGLNTTKDSHLPTEIVNTVDASALTFKAKYGTEYELSGNVIAKYPHFNMTLFNYKEGSFYMYELTSKGGFGKTHISCETKHPEKKHFFLEGLHFYYHSNSSGSINIYMPPQLLANGHR